MGSMSEWMLKFEDKLRNLGWLEKHINSLDLEEVSGYLDDYDTPEEAAEAFSKHCEEMMEADPGEMDGDHASALASAGWGTDEDYGLY